MLYLKKIIEFILKILARIILWRYRPTVIGITGSMGKSSTKEAIYSVLRERFNVRRNLKNFNNEIGLPLTVLGLESGGRSFWGWFVNILKALAAIFYYPNYPQILILEMGVDKPGDMKYLLSIARPHLAVVTGLGEIPVHVEFFKSPETLAREKSMLVRVLDKNDFALLNIDDALIKEMQGKTRAKTVLFGLSPESDFKVQELAFSHSLGEGEVSGMSFKINYDGKTVPFRLKNVLGQHQIYPALAAIAVGDVLGLNLVEVANALIDFQGLPGRMRLLGGIKNSFIIDDTYNASPAATERALETLKKVPGEGKKIAVLGDMLELGVYTEKAHRKIGRLVLGTADIFVAVGQRMKFALKEAQNVGFAKDNLYWFASSAEAQKTVQDLVDPGDLILVKGSQSMRMEKIVEEIMAEPERATELLVRQNKKWKRKQLIDCG